MTILEKKSARKKKAIYEMIKKGEYSLGYALSEVERLNDEGKLIDSDYEKLAEYIEKLLNMEENEQNDTEQNGTEHIEENEIEEGISEESTEEVVE